MGRKAQVKRSAEEKWEIVQEGLRSERHGLETMKPTT
jgi:hypothetical protein